MWCFKQFKIFCTETEMATDFEVFIYYDLRARIKGNKYLNELPINSYNGVLQNKFQFKIETYLQLDEQTRRKIKIKVKKRLPYLRKKFRRIRSKLYENILLT